MGRFLPKFAVGDKNLQRNHCTRGPHPQVIQVDGGPEYSGTFEDFCHQQQILVKTSIPRSPQTNGTAEAAVKSIKNILTRACAASPQGINNWSSLLPLVLSSK